VRFRLIVVGIGIRVGDQAGHCNAVAPELRGNTSPEILTPTRCMLAVDVAGLARPIPAPALAVVPGLTPATLVGVECALPCPPQAAISAAMVTPAVPASSERRVQTADIRVSSRSFI
ncbi:MAG TPA: hypothetical protein VHV31_01485, partial [Nitrolancea sp.]|nr:hypothetical protein [Nitrolancea sp.]